MRVKARVLVDQKITLGKKDRYTLLLKVYEVQKCKKFPDGIKAKFVLVDTLTNSTRLLMDNHDPYGFHMHLPAGSKQRVQLPETDFKSAMNVFQTRVNRIIKDEET